MAKKAKRLNGVLGIDIGSAAIKVCELRSQGGAPVVTALGITPTPEGSVDQTGIFNPEAVGAALKALVPTMGVGTKQAVASLNGTASVMLRVLDVPRMEDTELESHMAWEAERNNALPEIPKLAYARLTDHDVNSAEQRVVMALASPTAIDTLQIALQKGGQVPFAVDVSPLGEARLLATTMGPRIEGQTVCVVDFGAKSSQVNIYYGADLVLPRQILVGGEQMTQAIADAMGVGMAEAEEMKRRAEIPPSAMVAPAAATDNFYNPFGGGYDGGYDPSANFTGGYDAGNATQSFGTPEAGGNPFAEPPADNVNVYGDTATPPISDPSYDPTTFGAPDAGVPGSDLPSGATAYPAPDSVSPAPDATPVAAPDDPVFVAMRPVLEEFAGEVSRSIDYVRGQGSDVAMVTLIGGGARLKGLDGYLSAVLGLPVEVLDPLQSMSVSLKKTPPELAAEFGPDFANAIGNALHNFFD